MKIIDVNDVEFILSGTDYLLEVKYGEKITLIMREGSELNEIIVEDIDVNNEIIGIQLQKQVDATKS